MSRRGTVVILAAGQGTRMKSALPKVLHSVCGRTMIAWVIDQALSLDPERILVVVGHGAEAVREEVARQGHGERIGIVVQAEQKGTGHAVQQCLPLFPADPGPVVVLYGDMPALGHDTLRELLELREGAGAGATALLTSLPQDPRGFGRIKRSEDGSVVGIVEEKDCTPEERGISEVNLGVYAFDGPSLVQDLPRLQSNNSQGEFYLTDLVGLAVQAERLVITAPIEDEDEGIGVNNLGHLAEVRWALQMRILEEHMLAGVCIEDPATTYIDHGVVIGRGTKVFPCTVIRAGVRIGEECEVGPFTHLRVGTELADTAQVGNFTECKNAHLGQRSKAKHLSYLGDVEIGARTNIGAGTIFANYDGKQKHKTLVGDKAFVGSGTTIVAPNSIGNGATTGAGSVITRSARVGDGETWVGVPARLLGAKTSGRESSKS